MKKKFLCILAALIAIGNFSGCEKNDTIHTATQVETESVTTEFYSGSVTVSEQEALINSAEDNKEISPETPVVFAAYYFDDTYPGFEGRSLVLEMTNGSYDSGNSDYGAAWSGDFRFRLTVSNENSSYEISDSDVISPGFNFGFNEQFDISVDDYNNDGAPDFAVGQWGSLSGGSSCFLFSLFPDGTVVQKNIAENITGEENNTLWLPPEYNSVYSPFFEKEQGNCFSVSYFTYGGVMENELKLLSGDDIDKWFDDPRHSDHVMSEFTLKNIYEWTDDAVILTEQQILEPDGSVWTAG